MNHKDITICLLIIATLTSCEMDKIYPVEIQDGMYVIDRHGIVQDYKPDFSGNKVYTYAWARGLNEWLSLSPYGKIDKIIADNPDWEFVTYINGTVEDSTRIRKKLDKYNCNFPVILDTKEAFCKKNKSMNSMGLWGGMCNKHNELIGTSVIGDSLSFFDPTFEKVKRRLHRYEKR